MAIAASPRIHGAHEAAAVLARPDAVFPRAPASALESSRTVVMDSSLTPSSRRGSPYAVRGAWRHPALCLTHLLGENLGAPV